MNIVGALVFSAGFTNHYLTELHPAVFSWLGWVSVMLWGAAYIAVARRYREVPAIVAVFAVEKLVYVGTWLLWLSDMPVSWRTLFDRSLLTGAFFAVYGLIDLAFGLFFTWVAVTTRRGAGCAVRLSEPRPGS